MPVCQYFLQGKCNFGTRCRNEHPQTRSSAFGQSTSQAILKGGSGATGGAAPTSAFGFGNNRFGALATSAGGSGMSAFGQHSQTAFSGFGNTSSGFLSQSTGTLQNRPFDGSGQKLGANKPLDADQLRKLVMAPLIWKLSTFAPVGDKPSMLSGTDVSPEESRLEFVMAQRQTGNTVACQQQFDFLVNEMDHRLKDIAANAQVYASQWQQQHGDDSSGRAFGQQAAAASQSAFGQPNPTSSLSAFGGSGGAGGQLAFGQSAFGQQSAFPSSSGGGFSSTLAKEQTASAFGGGRSGGAFGLSSTGTSAFGVSKPAASAFGGSAFGQPASLLGGSKTTINSFGNSPQEIMEATGPQRDLTPEEIEGFKAPRFVFGRIPEVAPTPELCT
ncbi:Nucleoporin-like protein 2 [Coemansia sp. RSA 1813]|nr:Nucleoporin-like protein 2 [Coemansia sp. RSA 1646]KAJ1765491.1 Nucleoporin-like protein 2 [Coemansia sp. RSA 1843]KAJ2087841.1 Nucleoporin-like protein 2 [Coemansia sp. RSA 986]KAJ2212733.1 Nucleoporin-like protein 2 [Coemansia sp. RSA 487]KAJ2567472.1 Nucleoporin-like protein 2 [Coemansia sp. RSA 1813]